MNIIRKAGKTLGSIDYRRSLPVIVLFIFNLILVYSRLTPGLYDFNADDGVKYIESGRLLFTWGLRELAWAPLVAFIFAPIHIFTGNSPNWFLIDAWGGNIILFLLIWFSFYYLSCQFKYKQAPYIMIGMMIILTPIFLVLRNQADALFLPLSAFALANLIRFKTTGHIKYFWFASIFVGLGILARVETILLIATMVALGSLIGGKAIKFYKILLGSILPSLLILAVYVIASLITNQTVSFGIAGKSYESFEASQSVSTTGQFQINSPEQNAEIYGTIDENKGSVIVAGFRNPGAIIERTFKNLMSLPDLFFNFFGRTHGYLILLFSAWGLYALIRDREKSLLLILLIWPLHVLVVLIFITLHFFPQIMYSFFILATVGVCSFYNESTSVKQKFALLLIAVFTLIFTIIDHRHNLMISTSLLSLSLLVDIVIGSRQLIKGSLRILPLFLLVVIVLAFRASYEFPTRALGQTPLEKTFYFLEEALPVQSNVISYIPLHTAPARMNFVSMNELYLFDGKPDLFLNFIRENKISAVVFDDNFTTPQQQIAKQLVAANSSRFILGYQTGDQLIRVFLFRDEAPVNTP